MSFWGLISPGPNMGARFQVSHHSAALPRENRSCVYVGGPREPLKIQAQLISATRDIDWSLLEQRRLQAKSC